MKLKELLARPGVRRAGLGILLLTVVAFYTSQAETRLFVKQEAEETQVLEASGLLQVDEVSLASELGGRITAILAPAGAMVTEGEPLVQLDTALIDAEIASAEALVAVAKAGLAQAQAGVAPEELAVAAAQLAQARAGQLAAQQAVSDTQDLLEHPQDIDLQIAVTRARITVAGYEIEQAVARKDEATAAKQQAAAAVAQEGPHRIPAGSGSKEELPPGIGLPPNIPDGTYREGDLEIVIEDGLYHLFQWIDIQVPTAAHLGPHYWWQAWIGVNVATIQRNNLETELSDLYAQRAHPQTLEAQAAVTQYLPATAAAQVELAAAQLAGMRAGASAEELAALTAQVAQAQAAVQALEDKRALKTLVAPLTGAVVELIAQPGEVAAPGAPLLTLANLTAVTLVVYVPETRLGALSLGQEVAVTVDSFPQRIFTGHVQHIADQAEFTPRNVASKEERMNLVFAIEIGILNPTGELKPGMPADAVFKK
ncbi:MAG TPA: HlyD family efflux transporter periplasmic adaptor subunit [Thermoflexia bacterium]|nr:HlyD family efflux transporter periplasmic adaptor subunit [Thermoflexia bacterium]